jgi:flagellar hook protein FlgE
MMLNIPSTGLMATTKGLDAIANNLANADTTGFKSETAVFADFLSSDVSERPADRIGQGVITSGISRNNAQGTMQTTSSSLDVSINGNGYFVYGSSSAATGTSAPPTYSRDGELSIDPNGNLVDTNGAPILGYTATGGTLIANTPMPINIFTKTGNDPSKIASISIGSNGLVSVTTTDGTNTPVAALAIASFENPNGLRDITGTGFVETAQSGTAQLGVANTLNFGSVRQGSLEQSNVDITGQLVNMIQMQQAYNANAKALQTTSDMIHSAVENIAHS